MRKQQRSGTACTTCGVLFCGVSFKKPGSKGGNRWYFSAAYRTCGPQCETQAHQRTAKRNFAHQRGALHPNFAGGGREDWRGPNWAQVAAAARKRAGYKCQHCGSPQGRRALDVDHIEPFHNFPNAKAANRPRNLEALCRPCHSRKDAKTPKQLSLSLVVGGKLKLHRPGKARGDRVNTSKLTAAQVIVMRAERARGDSLPCLAKRYGIRHSSVWAIVHRKAWKHV